MKNAAAAPSTVAAPASVVSSSAPATEPAANSITGLLSPGYPAYSSASFSTSS
ncbi:MAG: hypothetical protein L6W00_11095 [Lentisphaeria bacterium]|nr:MAG: hypothetical protein L6W00_11095 [Lentisphaeria bacterium]